MKYDEYSSTIQNTKAVIYFYAHSINWHMVTFKSQQLTQNTSITSWTIDKKKLFLEAELKPLSEIVIVREKQYTLLQRNTAFLPQSIYRPLKSVTGDEIGYLDLRRMEIKIVPGIKPSSNYSFGAVYFSQDDKHMIFVEPVDPKTKISKMQDDDRHDEEEQGGSGLISNLKKIAKKTNAILPIHTKSKLERQPTIDHNKVICRISLFQKNSDPSKDAFNKLFDVEFMFTKDSFPEDIFFDTKCLILRSQKDFYKIQTSLGYSKVQDISEAAIFGIPTSTSFLMRRLTGTNFEACAVDGRIKLYDRQKRLFLDEPKLDSSYFDSSHIDSPQRAKLLEQNFNELTVHGFHPITQSNVTTGFWFFYSKGRRKAKQWHSTFDKVFLCGVFSFPKAKGQSLELNLQLDQLLEQEVFGNAADFIALKVTVSENGRYAGILVNSSNSERKLFVVDMRPEPHIIFSKEFPLADKNMNFTVTDEYLVYMTQDSRSASSTASNSSWGVTITKYHALRKSYRHNNAEVRPATERLDSQETPRLDLQVGKNPAVVEYFADEDPTDNMYHELKDEATAFNFAISKTRLVIVGVSKIVLIDLTQPKESGLTALDLPKEYKEHLQAVKNGLELSMSKSGKYLCFFVGALPKKAAAGGTDRKPGTMKSEDKKLLAHSLLQASSTMLKEGPVEKNQVAPKSEEAKIHPQKKEERLPNRIAVFRLDQFKKPRNAFFEIPSGQPVTRLLIPDDVVFYAFTTSNILRVYKLEPDFEEEEEQEEEELMAIEDKSQFKKFAKKVFDRWLKKKQREKQSRQHKKFAENRDYIGIQMNPRKLRMGEQAQITLQELILPSNADDFEAELTFLAESPEHAEKIVSFKISGISNLDNLFLMSFAQATKAYFDAMTEEQSLEAVTRILNLLSNYEPAQVKKNPIFTASLFLMDREDLFAQYLELDRFLSINDYLKNHELWRLIFEHPECSGSIRAFYSAFQRFVAAERGRPHIDQELMNQYLSLQMQENPKMESAIFVDLFKSMIFSRVSFQVTGELITENLSAVKLESGRSDLHHSSEIAEKANDLLRSNPKEIYHFDAYRSLFELDLTLGSEFSNGLFEKLSKLPNTHYDEFYKSLVDYKWRAIRGYSLVLFSLVLLMIGFSVVLLSMQRVEFAPVVYAFLGLFLILDSKIVVSFGTTGSVLNDLFAIVVDVCNIIATYRTARLRDDADGTFFRWVKLLVIASLLFRGIRRLRTIETVRFLTLMIIEVLVTIIPFLVVMGYVVAVFSIIWSNTPTFNPGSSPDEQASISVYNSMTVFIDINFGNYDSDVMHGLQYIVITCANILLALTMTNFIIAMIGNIYNHISEHSDMFDIQDKLSFIREADALFRTVVKVMRWRREDCLFRYVFLIKDTETDKDKQELFEKLVDFEQAFTEHAKELAETKKDFKLNIEKKLLLLEGNFDLKRNLQTSNELPRV